MTQGLREAAPLGPTQVTAEFASSIRPFLEEAEHIHRVRRYLIMASLLTDHLCCRDSPASRQIAVACIEHAFAIINANDMPLKEKNEQELERFMLIYSDLGGTLDKPGLLSHKNELLIRNQSNSSNNVSPLERRSSSKRQPSYKSLFNSLQVDEDDNYRGVDTLIAEVLFLLTLSQRRLTPIRLTP